MTCLERTTSLNAEPRPGRPGHWAPGRHAVPSAPAIAACSLGMGRSPFPARDPSAPTEWEETKCVCCVCAYCHFSRVRLFATPWAIARQAPLSMGFSREEHLSGLPFPPPGDLPDPGIKPTSPALAGGFFPTSAVWEAPNRGCEMSIKHNRSE